MFVFTALELFTYTGHPRSEYPTFSAFRTTFARRHAGRAFLFVAWLGLGWLFLSASRAGRKSETAGRWVVTRDLILAVWAAIGLSLVVFWLCPCSAPRLSPHRVQWSHAVMSSWPGRVLLVLGWMWLGWHLFARLGVPDGESGPPRRTYVRSRLRR